MQRLKDGRNDNRGGYNKGLKKSIREPFSARIEPEIRSKLKEFISKLHKEIEETRKNLKS